MRALTGAQPPALRSRTAPGLNEVRSIILSYLKPIYHGLEPLKCIRYSSRSMAGHHTAFRSLCGHCLSCSLLEVCGRG